MRCVYLAVILILLAAPAGLAQDSAPESAFGTELSDYGGFVGLETRFGEMGNDFAAFVGAEAAILLKQRVYLGLRGAGLASDSRVPSPDPGSGPLLGMGYGGFVVGYVVPLPGLVQLTADAMIGAGGVNLRERAGGDDEEWDAIFVFEPTLGFEIKLAPFARIGLGAAYRYVGAVDAAELRDLGLRDADLRDPTVTARLRLGWF